MTAPVSPATQQRLREAMKRLFDRQPIHTDGKLTKNNLWREAEVSRATMNRAADILAEWDARVADSLAGAVASHRGEELDDLRSSLEASRRRCRQLQDQVDAAATVIAALAAENATLRRQALNTSAVVVPLQQRSTVRA
ncbi:MULTISPECIES: hypothetical protein [Micromonospora]|jgi:hypothetical protein|uniref:hypothetical protein n=1 Tax=Micromonospora TaxID=1873 RepID=UPI0016573306|nr:MULTISPECIES: hypothetical protein [Micromonospora]MBC8989586.1 hypothetical protein [Micromonospora chalcea]